MAEKLLDESGLAVLRDWVRGQVQSGSVSEFDGATSLEDGVAGMVPQPLAGENTAYLKGDGTWSQPSELYDTQTVITIPYSAWQENSLHEAFGGIPPETLSSVPKYFATVPVPNAPPGGFGIRAFSDSGFNTEYLLNFYQAHPAASSVTLYALEGLTEIQGLDIRLICSIYPTTEESGQLWPIRMHLMWENASPSSSFAGLQRVYADSPAEIYDFIMMEASSIGAKPSVSGFLPTWRKRLEYQMVAPDVSTNKNGGRGFHIFGNEIEFGDGYYDGSVQNNVTAMIPYRIYGINLLNGVEGNGSAMRRRYKFDGVNQDVITLVGNPVWGDVDGNYIPHTPTGYIARYVASKQANGSNPTSAGYDNTVGEWKLVVTKQSNSYAYLTLLAGEDAPDKNSIFNSDGSFDVTDYNWLIVRCWCRGYGSNSNLIGLVSSPPTQGNNNGSSFAVREQITSSNNTGTNTWLYINISNLTGSYYLAMDVSGTGSYTGEISIMRAYLSVY